jgi:hypothetical protein
LSSIERYSYSAPLRAVLKSLDTAIESLEIWKQRVESAALPQQRGGTIKG